MKDYNEKYYKKARNILEDAGFNHYYYDLIDHATAYVQHYFPEGNRKEIAHAVIWALADAWGNGCEVEEN